jgi:peptidoglycan/LPS O-acetylase OafA/YrhL
LRYISQFDTLRALAVTLVLFEHWLPHDHWINTLNNGLIGVLLFFSLSGYLITSILLDNRLNFDPKISIWKKIKTFYIRRALRIFPIYYLILIFLFLISFQDIRSQFFYFLSYTQNFLFVSQNQNFGYLIHFWTLAVEEQFYLFWPLIIFFCPIKYLKFMIILLILFGFFFRNILEHNHLVIGPINFLMPSALDAFSLGGLLALLTQQKLIDKFLSVMNCFVIVIVSFILYYFKIIDFYFLVSLYSTIFIYVLSKGKGIVFDLIFKNKLIMFIGKISYGIYLIHYLIYPLNHWLHVKCVENNITIPFINKILIPEFNNDYLRFIYFYIVTFIFAAFSWYAFENPINKLKNRFNYK